jgi:hypothetical protein
MSKQLPKAVNQFRKRHPEVWKAFNDLGERCHEAGPLDEKSRRLVKLACRLEPVWKALHIRQSETRARLVSHRGRLITWRCLRSAL